MLAHAYRGEVAVSHMLAKDTMRYDAIPVIYTNPEVASAGETEKRQREKIDVRTAGNTYERAVYGRGQGATHREIVAHSRNNNSPAYTLSAVTRPSITETRLIKTEMSTTLEVVFPTRRFRYPKPCSNTTDKSRRRKKYAVFVDPLCCVPAENARIFPSTRTTHHYEKNSVSVMKTW